MRPRDRSYGDISTLTRSPTRIRILFFRIFPEIAANTTWSLLSSWTLKKALGCLSMIVPCAGIKSSAAKLILLGCGFRDAPQYQTLAEDTKSAVFEPVQKTS